MEIFTALLTLCVVGWSTSLLLAILLLTARSRANRRESDLREEFKSTLAFVVKQSQQVSSSSAETQGRQLELLEKAFAQLRATNAWEYQAIMSMNGVPAYDEQYDPSPEAEAQRIADRQNTKDDLDESLTAEEAAVLGDLFPGSF